MLPKLLWIGCSPDVSDWSSKECSHSCVLLFQDKTAVSLGKEKYIYIYVKGNYSMLYFRQSLASVVTTCLTSRPAETVSRTVRKAGVTLNKYGPVRSAVKPVVSCHQRQRSCQAVASLL